MGADRGSKNQPSEKLCMIMHKLFVRTAERDHTDIILTVVNRPRAAASMLAVRPENW